MVHAEITSENGVVNNSYHRTENKRPRAFIADDNTPMLETIVQLLMPHFDVVGTAQDGNAALKMIKQLKPDIAVLDISMPFKTGIEVAAYLKTNAPGIKIVIVSANHDESYVEAADSAGALAFIPKIRLADELVPAIENAFSENDSLLTQRSGQ
jgi:two-component system nitrate/nitrite response regulator NarL